VPAARTAYVAGYNRDATSLRRKQVIARIVMGSRPIRVFFYCFSVGFDAGGKTKIPE
jgi:hypothetical protein